MPHSSLDWDLRSPLKDTVGVILVFSVFLSIVCFLWNAIQVLHYGTPGTMSAPTMHVWVLNRVLLKKMSPGVG